MNTESTNNTNKSNNNNTQPSGYQELKLISFYHKTERYRIVAPLPITREVETAMVLWLPGIDPEFQRNGDFSKLWIQRPLAIRFAAELWRRFEKGGAALVLHDMERALEDAVNPIHHSLRQEQSRPELN